MGKKLFGFILVLVLIGVLWVIAANILQSHTPVDYQNISNADTFNFSITVDTNTNFSNCSWWNGTLAQDAWDCFNSTINTSAPGKVVFDVLANATYFEEGSGHYINVTCTTFQHGMINDSTTVIQDIIINLTFDRTAPTVYIQTPVNYTNSTSSSNTFSYNVTDVLLDIANCSLYFYKNGAWEENSTDTTITEKSNQTFTITVEDEVSWLWKVGCYDNAHNAGNASYFNLTVDRATGVSDITITDENKIRYITNPIKIKCVPSDGVIGVKSTTLKVTKPSGKTIEVSLTGAETDAWTHEFKHADTNEAGLYYVDCTVIDKLENIQMAPQKTFRVIYEDVGISEGDVEEKPVAKLEISTKETYSGIVSGKQGELKTFTLDGITAHTLEFIEVTFASATLKISSDSVEITLDVGKYKNMDLDADGTDDVKVTLESIDEDGRAKVEVINLAKLEEKEREEKGLTDMPVVEEESRAGLLLTILVILVVIAVGYYLLKKRKGKKGSVKFSKQDMGL